MTLLTIVCRLQLFFEFEEHLPQAQKTQLGELFEQHVRPNTCYKNHVDGRDWRCVSITGRFACLSAASHD